MNEYDMAMAIVRLLEKCTSFVQYILINMHCNTHIFAEYAADKMYIVLWLLWNRCMGGIGGVVVRFDRPQSN